jgi:hypothetical protein
MRLVALPSGHRPILYGETPFGWRLNDDRSRLVMDDDEQRLLSVVRHMYLVERLPMRGIVDRLRKMGVRNRRGRPFGLSGVWEMIHRRNEPPPESKRGARKAPAAKAKRATRKAAPRRRG